MNTRINDLLISVLLLFAINTTANAQCEPIVTGEFRVSAGIGLPAGAPLAGELFDFVTLLAEQCGEANVEFLRVRASHNFNDGSNTVDFNTTVGLREFIGLSNLRVEDFFNLSNPLAPNFDAQPCIVVEQKPIAELRGGWNLNSTSIGSGPNEVRANATFRVCDEIQIESPIATTLELPIHISGSVLAAESFGDPNVTRGYAKLELTGSVAGTTIGPLVAEAESVSVIPEMATISHNETIPITVSPGITTISLTIDGTAEAAAKSQCAGLFCLLTGAATAGIDFPDSIHIGNFTGEGGGPVPEGIRITSLQSGMEYISASDGATLFGDVNLDGQVNLLDVAPFVDRLISGVFQTEADVNMDGVIDLLDVSPFVAILTG